MNEKTTEKRILKGYKIRQSEYNRAMRRAKKEKLHLASLIEAWIRQYGNGAVFMVDSNIK